MIEDKKENPLLNPVEISKPVAEHELANLDLPELNLPKLEDATVNDYPKLKPSVIKTPTGETIIELPICAIVEVKVVTNEKPDTGQSYYVGRRINKLAITFEGRKSDIKEKKAARFTLYLQPANLAAKTREGKEFGNDVFARSMEEINHIWTVLGGSFEALKAINTDAHKIATKEGYAEGWITTVDGKAQIEPTAKSKYFFAYYTALYNGLVDPILKLALTSAQGEDKFGNPNNRRWMRLHIQLNDKNYWVIPNYNNAPFLELYQEGVKPAIVPATSGRYVETEKSKTPLNQGLNHGLANMPNMPPAGGGQPFDLNQFMVK